MDATSFVTSLDEIDRQRPLYLYGASEFGRFVLQRLRAGGFANVAGFLDSFKAGEFEALPVIRLEDYLTRRRPEDIIILTTSAEEAVAATLAGHGITEVRVLASSDLRPTRVNVYRAGDPESEGLVLRSECLAPAAAPAGPLTWQGIFAVWGETHLGLMIDVALPSLLAAGNLPEMARWRGSSLNFYLPAAEAEVLRRAPVMAEAARHVGLHLHIIPDLPAGMSKYLYMNRINHAGLLAAERGTVVNSVLAPDTLYAEHSLGNAMARIEQGFDAVVLPSAARCDGRTVMPLLEGLRHGPVLSASQRRLVALYLRHRHPVMDSYWAESRQCNRYPCHVQWPVGQDGLVMRSIIAHPFMIRPQRRNGYFTQTCDYDYAPQSIVDKDKIHVCDDSDEIFVVDIVPPGTSFETLTLSSFSMPVYREFIRQFLCDNPLAAYYRRLLDTPLLIHAEPCDGPAWTDVRMRSDRFVAAALEDPRFR